MGVGETYNWKPKEFEIQCEVLEILPESRWDIANLGNIGFSQGYSVLFVKHQGSFFGCDTFWKTFSKWDPAAGYFSESNGFNDVLKVNILHKRSNFKVIKDDRVIRDEGTYLKAY